MEIERKYLVKDIPEDLEKYSKRVIEQGYLCDNPVVRIRRLDDEYILTYKNHMSASEDTNTCVNEEVELPLTLSSYEHLKSTVDGFIIEKERYVIPYANHKIELDIFKGNNEGLIFAEVEFESIKAAEEFVPPVWFGENVSGDIRYTNSYISKNPFK